MSSSADRRCDCAEWLRNCWLARWSVCIILLSISIDDVLVFNETYSVRYSSVVLRMLYVKHKPSSVHTSEKYSSCTLSSCLIWHTSIILSSFGASCSESMRSIDYIEYAIKTCIATKVPCAYQLKLLVNLRSWWFICKIQTGRHMRIAHLQNGL